MRDLIDDALDDSGDEKTAQGIVEEQDITVKKEHVTTPKNEDYWMVKVYIGSDDIPSEKESRLDASEAESLFQEQVNSYDLTVDDLDAESKNSEIRAWRVKDGNNSDLVLSDAKEHALYKSKISDSVSVDEIEGDDSNTGHVISAEDCDECGGELVKISDTTTGSGVADSYEAECLKCSNTQHVASW